MRPATNQGGVREDIECSPTHESAMEDNDDQDSSNHLSEVTTNVPSQSSNSNDVDRVRDPAQPPSSGLRHDPPSVGANVNMPDTYARIKAYKPPAYVSPYVKSTDAPAPAADKTSALSTQVSRPRILSAHQNDLPWLCCFAQRRIPEWRRHLEVWNPGTATVCTVSVPHPCQHVQCGDCVLQSLEETIENTTTTVAFNAEATQTNVEDDVKGAEPIEETAEVVSQEETAHSENTPGMTPSSMLMPKAANWDPKTRRLRLWPKD
ncbi:hypothetical protein ONS95_005086 [Cadophora gregata]|uniref:uncharacterized protein n=1 Tax=Cadophora gregata TaxID=51156 RepID=UPI0026DB36A9|nr:uncharacterized protein ONS95_005086 [Cadophora gregata]KAK0104818.1 hypothetical protein ONS95_005086 [Cadophora gregata]KAK0115099.1 hypothetical protein ONS96_013569 [Cadophora gregata f. sp. sojae]